VQGRLGNAVIKNEVTAFAAGDKNHPLPLPHCANAVGKFEADTNLFNVSEISPEYDFKVYSRRIQTFDAYLNLQMPLFRNAAASSIWAMLSVSVA
jgi:hypothetical protein